MYKGSKVVVVMPAYNAEKTLRTAYDEVVAQGVADTIVIVDDCSKDGTEAVAARLSEELRVKSEKCAEPRLIYRGMKRTGAMAATRRAATNWP